MNPNEKPGFIDYVRIYAEQDCQMNEQELLNAYEEFKLWLTNATNEIQPISMQLRCLKFIHVELIGIYNSLIADEGKKKLLYNHGVDKCHFYGSIRNRAN